MGKSVRKYTEEFKQEAVKLALKSPSTSHAARQLGVPFVTLCGWVKRFKDHHASSVHAPNGDTLSAIMEENRRLRKELEIACEEKEILKKAATYFAKHQK